MMPRDGAATMSLTGGTGAITHMFSFPHGMEVYKIDRTFRAQTPDDIDPQRTKPDIPWAWKMSDDVGSSNPIVGRVFIQCTEALNGKTLRRGKPETIRVALHTCKEDLRNCEKTFRRLVVEFNALVDEAKATGGVHTAKGVVNLPQVPNLEHDVTIFLTSGKRVLQSIAEVLNEFYGITITNARFDKGKTQLKALTPVPANQVSCLEHFTPVIERLLNLRNFQEHSPKKTIIDNIHLTADGLNPPMWRVDPELGQELLPAMQEMLDSLIGLAEESFFCGLMDDLVVPPGPFGYSIQEIPESQRNGAAVYYRCELTFVTESREGNAA